MSHQLTLITAYTPILSPRVMTIRGRTAKEGLFRSPPVLVGWETGSEMARAKKRRIQEKIQNRKQKFYFYNSLKEPHEH